MIFPDFVPDTEIKFIKEDKWIGVYYKEVLAYDFDKCQMLRATKYFICIIPCFPIIYTTKFRYKEIT